MNRLHTSLSLVVLAAVVASCSGDGPTGPPAPAAIAAVGSTTLSAVAGTAVATAPAVRVTSAKGVGVSGVSVNFVVSAGGGSVTGGNAVTNADGVATVTSWTLGNSAGANTLVATSPALPAAAVVFNATGSVGAPATIQFSRDSLLLDQWGDTASLSVTVRDVNNNVIASPTLTWNSADAAVATVTNGLVSSVRTGRVLAQVTAASGTFAPVTATIPVRVVAQRNLACVAPTSTARGAAAAVATYGSAEILSTLTSPTWDGSRSIAYDFDNDGDDDIVRFEYSFPFSTTYSGTIRVFKADAGVLRDSSAVFAPAGVIPDHPRDFEVADFDRDGLDELLLVQHGYDANPFPGAQNILLRPQGGALANVITSRFVGSASNGFSHGSSRADIDCDGDLDVMELILTPAATNRLWINGGNGVFSNGTSQAQVTAGTAGQRWQEVEFIDFDNDGDPDMYLGARSGAGWNEDVLLVNNGFGQFRRSTAVTLPAPRFATAHGVNNAKAADFNGDGRQDLILFEIPQPFSSSSAIRLWLNNGNGGFTDASVTWGLPNTCSAEIIEPLYVRDMNRDGWPDVMIPNGCAEVGGAGILTNSGSGFSHFSYGNIISFINDAIATPIDVDGDGDLDLFFGERGGNPVLVRKP